MKPVTLPPTHYASNWKTDVPPRPLDEITALGCRYAELKDGAEKEDLLLELCQCFHPYLMKYLVMICRGHVPVAGHGANPSFINKDVKPFLMYFLPKGQKPGARRSMSKVTRHLHLAFKGMETEEVYDVLIEHLINTIKGYDPHYKRKVKCIAEVIKHELSKRKQFTAADANGDVGVNYDRYLRLLVGVGFLRLVEEGRAAKENLSSRFDLGNSKRLANESLLDENCRVSCRRSRPREFRRRQHEPQNFCPR